MQFNHLNIPESWQQYFSKYPNGLSLLEALIEWVSQVNSMVDNVNDININQMIIDDLKQCFILIY